MTATGLLNRHTTIFVSLLACIVLLVTMGNHGAAGSRGFLALQTPGATPVASPAAEVPKLPDDPVSQVHVTWDGERETIWVVSASQLYMSADDGRSFTPVEGDWEERFHDGATLDTDVTGRTLLLLDGSDSISGNVSEIRPDGVSPSVYPWEIWSDWAFSPEFPVSGEVLAVGGDPYTTSNLWFSYEFGASFDPYAFPANVYQDIVAVHWDADGIWILQSNVRQKSPIEEHDAGFLVSEVYFAPSPDGPWQRDGSWKDTSESEIVTASQIIVGPGRHTCMVAQEFDNDSDAGATLSGTSFLTCLVDGAWQRTAWPADSIPFDPHDGWQSRGPVDDGFTEQTVWLPADGTIYQAVGESSDIVMFASPDDEPRAVTMPNLPGRIGLRSFEVSPAGHLYAATGIGLFRSEDQGTTWTALSGPLTGQTIDADTAAPDQVDLPLFSGFTGPEQLLPTNAEALQGMMLVGEGERTLEESMAAFDFTSSELASLQEDSGWQTTVYRDFGRTGSVEDTSAITALSVEVHQFDDTSGASRAIEAFYDELYDSPDYSSPENVAAPDGATLGDGAYAVTAVDRSENNRVELYVLVDDYIVHVTGISPTGEPLPVMVNLVQGILNPALRE